MEIIKKLNGVPFKAFESDVKNCFLLYRDIVIDAMFRIGFYDGNMMMGLYPVMGLNGRYTYELRKLRVEMDDDFKQSRSWVASDGKRGDFVYAKDIEIFAVIDPKNIKNIVTDKGIIGSVKISDGAMGELLSYMQNAVYTDNQMLIIHSVNFINSLYMYNSNHREIEQVGTQLAWHDVEPDFR